VCKVVIINLRFEILNLVFLIVRNDSLNAMLAYDFVYFVLIEENEFLIYFFIIN